MGRKPTTGRFDTRKEFEETVFTLYDMPRYTITKIANFVGASQNTVSKLIDKGFYLWKKENP